MIWDWMLSSLFWTGLSNAMNRTNQYNQARSLEGQLDEAYDKIAQNLQKMKDTYSDELAGKSTASELEARNRGINDLAKSQDIAQEQFAQALARMGVSSSGASPTDVVARGLGEIGSEYTGGIADIDRSLALAADRRKSAVERAMLDYETDAHSQLAEAEAALEELKQGLRSTDFSQGNVFEILGNVMAQNPQAVLAGGIGEVGNALGGNYNVSNMVNTAGLDSLGGSLGIDLKGILASGLEDSSAEIVQMDPTKDIYSRRKKRDAFGNVIGYDDPELVSKGSNPSVEMQKQKLALSKLQTVLGDDWDSFSVEDKMNLINDYIATGDLQGTIEKIGFLNKGRKYNRNVPRNISGGGSRNKISM